MDPHDAETAAEARRQALRLYAEMAARLRDAIDALAASAPSADVEAAVRAHQHTLLMVLGFEEALVNRRRRPAEAGGGALDLDAARAEVARRLARLRAARRRGRAARGAEP